MDPARRLAAARHGRTAAALIVVALAAPHAARAEGEAQLLLPIVRAMALGMTAVEATKATATADRMRPPPATPRRSVIPSRLEIPDAYALDPNRAPRMFAAPVDAERIVGFDVLRRPERNLAAGLVYDEEDRGPFPGTGEVVRFVVEIGF